MKYTETKTLKAGERVIWPEGANENKECAGLVVGASKYESKHILWVDGQKTYLNDDAAMEFVQRAKDVSNG